MAHEKTKHARDKTTRDDSTRKVHLGKITPHMQKLPDGSYLVAAEQKLPPYPTSLMNSLQHWAQISPHTTFLADRRIEQSQQTEEGDGWRHLTYEDAWNSARSIGQYLLNKGLNAENPVIILSGNSIEHGQLALACQVAGIAYAPVSPAYSLRDKSYAKLRHIFNLLTPGMVFVDDINAFEPALRACLPKDVELVSVRGNSELEYTSFAHMLATAPSTPINAAYENLSGDTIAKFLFTSGSTGLPKAVINSHKMLAYNQTMLANALAFLKDEPPILVDWLPWNHTAGGNHNFGVALFNGGTLYIDEGKPVPGAFDQTIFNLTQIAPTVYFGVPKSYEMLADALGRNEGLKQTFFSRLLAMQYAGAGLAQHVWDALEKAAVETVGEKILIMTGYGATETSPFFFTTTGPVPGAGYVGVPSPGVEMKLVPTQGKLAVHVRGPSITSGYWRMPELTEESFDDQGFYAMGDALKFVDPNDVGKGFKFDGRTSEDFKLSSGTWVNMGQVRTRLIAALAPFVRDAVITGINRNDIGAMVFLDLDAVRNVWPELLGLDESMAAQFPALRQAIQSSLNQFASQSTGSSTRVARLTILEHAPSLERGEITDKGSINQNVIMRERAELVELMHAKPTPARLLSAQVLLVQ